MRGERYAEAIYGDCLPDGRKCYLRLSGNLGVKLVTSDEEVSIPEGDTGLFYARLSPVPGPCRTLVKSHAFVQTYVREGGQWTLLNRVSHGVQGHIFDPSGNPVLMPAGPGADVNGIRYWSNGPVYGTHTYAPAAGSRLYAWSLYDGIRIGQGPDSGLWIEKDGRTYELASGHTEYIQVHKDGDNWSVAATRLDQRDVLMFWFTTQEIDTLPEVQAEAPPQGPGQIAQFPRKIWCAPYYSWSRKYGVTSDPVGNCQWIETDDRHLAPVGHALMLDGIMPIPPNLLDPTVIAWAGAAYMNEPRGEHLSMKDAVTRCKANFHGPVFAYLDVEEWPAERPGWLQNDKRTWPVVQVYRHPGEGLEAFQARTTAHLERVCRWAPFVGLELAFYTRNDAVPVKEIVECMSHYERLIRGYPVVAISLFADRRPTGMTSYPVLREWAKAFAAACVRPRRGDYWEADSVDPDPNPGGPHECPLCGLLHEPPSEIPAELEDQIELVRACRAQVASPVEPIGSYDRQFEVAKRVAWALRDKGVGLVEAKGGSTNNSAGYTTDIVALSNGAHWDIAMDGGNTGWPDWRLEDEVNWPVIKPRWRPPIPV